MGFAWYVIEIMFNRGLAASLLNLWIIVSLCVCAAAVLAACVRLVVVDLKKRIIPTECLGIILIARIQLMLLSFYESSFVGWFGASSLLASCACAFTISALFFLFGLVVSSVSQRDSLGFGDVKLLFVLLVWCPCDYLVHFLIFLAIAGAMWAFAMGLILHQKSFAYGPVLVGSFFGVLVFNIF